PMGEDCLRANIWTPAKTVDDKLPVMVWIFGGGYREGYPHEQEFDGERIASRGVILVSIGYRLNCFGFLCHPEITAENPDAPANYGLLDQRFGIEWVKRNIANFGGDPENITVFGQSAGGSAVMHHLAAAQNEGLFQKAIPQSFGGTGTVYPRSFMGGVGSLKEAEETGVKFFRDYLGVETLEEARKLDADFVEKKFLEANLWLRVVDDGHYVKEDYTVTAREGRMVNVPIMTGYNTNEGFYRGPGQVNPMAPADPNASDEDTEKWIRSEFGDKADEYLAACRQTAAEKGITLAKAAICFISGFTLYVLARQREKVGQKTYVYHFGPSIPGDNAGAFHSCDLWFEFETLMKCWRPFDGHHFDLSRKMCNYWTNFAKTGDPNGNDKDGTPMPQWDPYTEADPCQIEFLDEITVGHGPVDANTRCLIELNI
ncbi:MAG: carboxylesterase family protein, partial [Oscillospiraceae bacterium]|nr:carboxylesterase family protein [Oscillospiraceae bacterium]